MTASKNLLLLSNAGSARGYLADAIEPIGSMGMAGKTALFIPYAGISRTWDAYEALVRESLRDTEVDVVSIHRSKDARLALEQADMVMVGGGNTFNLLLECRTRGLLVPLSNRVAGGLPYVGWSAGSLLCCPTIRTTNDMPIVEPFKSTAFALQTPGEVSDIVETRFGYHLIKLLERKPKPSCTDAMAIMMPILVTDTPRPSRCAGSTTSARTRSSPACCSCASCSSG